MVRPRTSATQLARLFGAVAQPIYLVDEEWTIVFCNQACLDWLGRSEEQVVGRRCRYHSSTEADPGATASAERGTPNGEYASWASTAPSGPVHCRTEPKASPCG